MESIRKFVGKAIWVLSAISLLGAVGSLIGVFLTPSYRNDPFIISLLSCLLASILFAWMACVAEAASLYISKNKLVCEK